jgi:hypothetical protein
MTTCGRVHVVMHVPPTPASSGIVVTAESRLTVTLVMFEPRAQNENPVYVLASTAAVAQNPDPRQLMLVMVLLSA